MKRTVIYCLFLIVGIVAFAQVSIRGKQDYYNSGFENLHKVYTCGSYDSIAPINPTNVTTFVGQRMLFRPCHINEKDRIAFDLYDQPFDIHNKGRKGYHGAMWTNYRGKNVPVALLSDIEDCEFEVLKIFQTEIEEDINDYIKSGSTVYSFMLKNECFGDTLYWDYIPNSILSRSEEFFPIGYYEKIKKDFVGEDFYLIFDRSLKPIHGKRINIPANTVFRCIDVVYDKNIDSYEDPLFAIMKNEQYGIFELNVSNYKVDEFVSDNYLKECKKKYGKYGGDVARGWIDIGMTKEMVETAYGKPKNINYMVSYNSYDEQWIYSYCYVYFRNGKVVVIQDF